jgi:hypothetical protein
MLRRGGIARRRPSPGARSGVPGPGGELTVQPRPWAPAWPSLAEAGVHLPFQSRSSPVPVADATVHPGLQPDIYNLRSKRYYLELGLGTRGSRCGGRNMDMWWWVPIGLAAWFLASVVIALCVGPVLRRSSQVREALDQQSAAMSDGHGRRGMSGTPLRNGRAQAQAAVSPFPPLGALAIPSSSGSADPCTLKRTRRNGTARRSTQDGPPVHNSHKSAATAPYDSNGPAVEAPNHRANSS